MNTIALIILAALLLDAGLKFAADWLNLKRLHSELPEAFADWYDPERYRRSQDYLRVNTRFEWIVTGGDLLLLLTFWFGGGFAWLDEWVRGFAFSTLTTGLLFIGFLVALKGLLNLPFDIYATFCKKFAKVCKGSWAVP